MIGTFVVKKLWSKSTKKILEYSIKIQNNWKTKTFIFRSKFNLHSYKYLMPISYTKKGNQDDGVRMLFES